MQYKMMRRDRLCRRTVMIQRFKVIGTLLALFAALACIVGFGSLTIARAITQGTIGGEAFGVVLGFVILFGILPME